MINMNLARKQNLTEEEVATVEHLQLMRSGLVSLATQYAKEIQLQGANVNCTFISGLRTIYKAWVRNEFDLQRTWHFPLDAKFHRFWEFPGCSCPQLDNLDSYPYLQYISNNCLVHGNSELTQAAE
jgi:hypothetical protein